MAVERSSRREILRKLVTLGPVAALAGAFGIDGAKKAEAWTSNNDPFTVPGKLGVGIDPPTVPFEVSGGTSSSMTIAKLFNAVDATGENVELLLGKSVGSGQAGRLMYVHDASTPDSRYLGLGTEGGGLPLVVTYAGNVGVGIASPNAKLDVAGNIHLSGSIQMPSSNTMEGTARQAYYAS